LAFIRIIEKYGMIALKSIFSNLFKKILASKRLYKEAWKAIIGEITKWF